MNRLSDTKNLSGIRLYALFILRLVIGWHFLYEGVTKLMMMPGWTSADYLQASSWWFAPVFHWIAETPSLLIMVDWFKYHRNDCGWCYPDFWFVRTCGRSGWHVAAFFVLAVEPAICEQRF